MDIINLDALPSYEVFLLQWVTIDKYGLHYVAYPDEELSGRHVKIIDLTNTITIKTTNEEKFELTLFLLQGEHPIIVRAPNKKALELVKTALDAFQMKISKHTEKEKKKRLAIAR